MKKFDVTLTGQYEKTIAVYADSPEQAMEKVHTILFDTDLIDFSDEDFVCGEADIKDINEDEFKEYYDENVDKKNGNCSECACFCPVKKECMCKDGSEELCLSKH